MIRALRMLSAVTTPIAAGIAAGVGVAVVAKAALSGSVVGPTITLAALAVLWCVRRMRGPATPRAREATVMMRHPGSSDPAYGPSKA